MNSAVGVVEAEIAWGGAGIETAQAASAGLSRASPPPPLGRLRGFTAIGTDRHGERRDDTAGNAT